jgi:hypothetical protein
MKKMWKILLALGVLAALTAGPASAYLINFDNLVPGTVIDGVNPGGVTISSPAPARTIVTTGAGFGVGWTSPLNAITNLGVNGNFLTFYPLTMTFDAPQSSIAFTGGDVGGDLDQFTVTAYDVNNVVLGVFVTPVFGGTNPSQNFMADQFTVQLNFLGGMKTVVVSNAIPAGIGIDNVQFCETPLPQSVLLLGSGLFGLIGLGRRFTT